MTYTTACEVVALHQPSSRSPLVNRFLPARCRTCGDEWPCPPRRLAGAVIQAQGGDPGRGRPVY